MYKDTSEKSTVNNILGVGHITDNLITFWNALRHEWPI